MQENNPKAEKLPPERSPLIEAARREGAILCPETCFLLEDDPPEQHAKPIACGKCWNALSAELEISQAFNSSRAETLADAAVYIRRMAKILEGYNHPSGIHRRAVAFADQKLRGFERTIVAKDGER